MKMPTQTDYIKYQTKDYGEGQALQNDIETSAKKSKPQQTCRDSFVLSGSTDEILSKKSPTPNAFNKMLPSNWSDKGGHFLHQLKDRAPDAGYSTLSDVEDLVRRGTLEPEGHVANRFKVCESVGSSRGQRTACVIFDVNKDKCELVTFLVS